MRPGLDEDEMMEASLQSFASEVVGHRIVEVEQGVPIRGVVANAARAYAIGRNYDGKAALVLTLDNGKRVGLVETGECCAYTSLQAVIQRLPEMDHAITSVKHEDGHEVWHIMAGADDVLDLEIDWSEGTGYYLYGFNVVVQEVAP